MTRRLAPLLMLAVLCLSTLPASICRAQQIVVGSKKFAESNVLGEIVCRVVERAGFTCDHKEDMGNTAIVWAALKGGGITVYPEYTGTVSQEILKVPGEMTPEAMRAALAKDGVGMSDELGFNDTYALVMRRQDAQRLNIHKISDLKGHPDLKIEVTHEFLGRKDGWAPLARRYGLNFPDVTGIEHGLAYRALQSGAIQLTDAYSTDAEIKEYDLEALQDDLGYFPKYKAVLLYRLDIPAKALAALQKLAGTIDEAKMIQMNALAKKTKDYAQAAALYFATPAGKAASGGGQTTSGSGGASLAARIAARTGEHLALVGISLGIALLLGIPLGIAASRPGALSQSILGVTGLFQTIPSLALLAMMVPLLGIGAKPAIVALVLYSLLPIVRNTATGLMDIPGPLRESAAALGLEPRAQLFKVYLPMASRTILAGIKTSAIINVGTATLAALVGGPGLGQFIQTGLSLNDNKTILEGAIPAAVLALLVQWGFDALDLVLIPRGLRLPPNRE